MIWGRNLFLGAVVSSFPLFCFAGWISAPVYWPYYVINANGDTPLFSSPVSACAAYVKYVYPSSPSVRYYFDGVKVESDYERLGDGYPKNKGIVYCKFSYTNYYPNGETYTGKDETDGVVWTNSCPSPKNGYQTNLGADSVERCECTAGYVEKFNQCVTPEEADTVKADYKNSPTSCAVPVVGNPIKEGLHKPPGHVLGVGLIA